MVERARYGRQISLREIGEAGQARLSASAVTLTQTGFARTIESRYLRGAGVRVLDVAVEGSATPHLAANELLLSLELRHEAAREVARGASAALTALRAIVIAESAEGAP